MKESALRMWKVIARRTIRRQQQIEESMRMFDQFIAALQEAERQRREEEARRW